MKTSMRENNLLRADSKRPTRHITKLISLALIAPLFLCVFAFQADAQGLDRIEAGADYNFVHTNAPPGACGCFSMNGGDGWAGWRFTDHISGVFQVASQHGSNINGTAADLTLTSFMAGPRITMFRARRLQPFGQVLLGGAHASGLLTPAANGLSGSANAFVFIAGGGVDFRAAGHFSIRLAEVDYFYTRFENGVNQRQNNLRVSAGVVFRFDSFR